jgi:DNA-binding protein HU-beta
MNKTQLIENVAKSTGLSKSATTKTVDAALVALTEALKDGQTVNLIGFGAFSVRTRKARTGRDPRTGQVINIAESKVPTFKAGKGLKDAVK